MSNTEAPIELPTRAQAVLTSIDRATWPPSI
jgi:hypothetical protein